MPQISAIVCTHNRSRILPLALDSLVKQTLPPHCFEILVVASGCTDDTPAVVESFRVAYPGHQITLIVEPRPGLGIARNSGAAAARSSLLAFLDDDARACSDWLERGFQHFSREGACLLCVGGVIEPLYLTPKPSWFLDGYEAFRLGDRARWLNPGEFLLGSNMIWRRSVVEKLNGFPTQGSPRGGAMGLGEETSLFENLWRTEQNARFLYDPELKVEHLVPASKMTVAYRWKRAYVSGRDWYDLYGPRSVASRLVFVARKSLGLGLALVRSPSRLRASHGTIDWFIQVSQDIATRLGVLLSAVGLVVRVNQASHQSTNLPHGPKATNPASAA